MVSAWWGFAGRDKLRCALALWAHLDCLTDDLWLNLHCDVSHSCCCSHMPPELLRHGRMSAAVDIYSFGVMSEHKFCMLSPCIVQITVSAFACFPFYILLGNKV
jgi:serine/threonine protein kinase